MPKIKQDIVSTSEISELSKIDYIKHKNRWFLYGGIGLLILGGSLIVYLFADYYYFSFNFKKKTLSDFSNFIVAISSLFFTTSSIFFLIYNLIIQREALQIQHEDLQTSKEELQQNNVTFKKQQESLSLQQAETTFFNLINFHRNLVADIITQHPDRFFKNLKTELYETSLNFHSDIISAKFMSASDLHNCPYHYKVVG